MGKMLQIDDLVTAHEQQRLAVVSIDLQYMFQNFQENTKSENERYASYNQDCGAALDFYRQKKVPIIHVGHDVTKLDRHFKEDRQQIEEHFKDYRFNQDELCIDQRSNTMLRTDLLHPLKNEETVYLKPTISAFNEDNILNTLLKHRNIDTLLFMGVFTAQCVYTSMANAHYLGYQVAGIADLMESDCPEINAAARLRENSRFFKTAAPSILIASQELVEHVLYDFEPALANKTVAAASLKL